MSDTTFVDLIISRIKNHKIIAVVIVTGVALIALGNLTDAVTKIGRLSRQVLGIDNPPPYDLDLINRQLRPVYFDRYMKPIESRSPTANKNDSDPFGRRSELDIEGAETLKRYAELLKKLSVDYTLLIEGHTSRTVNTFTNISLSRTRAWNVYYYLQQLGIPSERMEVVHVGGEESEGRNDPYTEHVAFRIFID